MLPSGAVSRISPSRGFSAANTTRNGAPFHGAIGEAKNASSAASSHVPGEPSARESIPEQRTKKNAPAISDTADLGANWRSGNNCAPCPLAPPIQLSRKLWLKSWQNRFASDTDQTAKSQRAGAMAHLNCSSTNHFLSLREQFLERPGACGGWPAGWGKLQWLGPRQLPFCKTENVRSRRRFIFLAVTP